MGDKIIERPNSKTYIFGDLKIIGRDNFKAALREDQKLLDSLVEKVRAELGEIKHSFNPSTATEAK